MSNELVVWLGSRLGECWHKSFGSRIIGRMSNEVEVWVGVWVGEW